MACSHWHKFLHDDATSKKALNALKKLYADEEPRVRVAVVRSMGHFKSAETLPLLAQGIKDKDWRVRGQSVRALARRKSNESVTILVNAMKGEKGRLIDDINKVLKSITGKDFKYPEQWAGWWKGVGQKMPKPEAKGSDMKPGENAGKKPKRKPDHRFYGIPTNSDKICYIIDVSGSMAKKVEEWKRVTITGKQGDRRRGTGQDAHGGRQERAQARALQPQQRRRASRSSSSRTRCRPGARRRSRPRARTRSSP